MNVQLCWETKEMEKGKIRVSKMMTIKEAMKIYKKAIEPIAVKAYLRRRSEYHYYHYKTLKEEA